MVTKIFLIALLAGWCHCQGAASNIEIIEYPCGVSDIDMDCVRDYAYRSIPCTRAQHCDGQPVYIPRQVKYIPNLNATFTCIDGQVTFYGTKLVTFYLNKATNVLVFAVDFDSIDKNCPVGKIELAQRASEPIVVQDYAKMTYALELTANIKYCPEYNGYSFEDITVSAFNKEPFPYFEVGPNVTQSTDPKVQRFLQLIEDDQPTAVQELFLTGAYYDFHAFIAAYVCDYGQPYNGAVNRP